MSIPTFASYNQYNPATASQGDIEIWKREMKQYFKEDNTLKQNIKTIFTLA
jgi:hypothetical protein